LNNLALVKIDGNWNTIDTTGQFVDVPLIADNEDLSVFPNNQFSGVKRRDGQMLIFPVYEQINNFHEGFAVIKIPRLFGLYNSMGQLMVKTQIPSISLAGNGLIQLMKTDEIDCLK